ncbi:hypothetical protein [Leptospira brenneri]|uniref:hypothetical protein n=1 Tax=Leptospira brenneri TaxID=2023182 RepID=UPI001FCC4248|nr:hypothetical protein [Leptospira brenneri]
MDVVLSVVANLSFFSLYLNQPIRPSLIIFYISSVWALYLADHLWDAFREKERVSDRGKFYLSFRQEIVSFLIFLVFTSLFIGIHFEFSFLEKNLPLLIAFVFSIYLIVKNHSPIPKEILVSAFYCLGLLAPFGSFGGLDLVFWIFFIHVFANVLLTYNTDREFDLLHNTFTMTRYLKPKTVKTLTQILLGLGSFCLLWASIWGNLSFWFLLGLGFTYIWLGVCSFLTGREHPFKSFCELSYLPMFLPQIFFFFSLLP